MTSRTLLASLLAMTAVQRGTAEETPAPLASWTSQGIDYVWDETNVREEFLASGAFQPNFNNMAGIKIKPGSTADATTVFISVPRWFPGVPSTLNKITLDLNADAPINPLLEP